MTEGTDSTIERSLDGITLLAPLAADKRAALAAKCQWESFTKDQEVLSRTATTRDVLFVVRGTVRIVNYSEGGREVAYARIEEGDYFGEMAAIDDGPRSASVVAQDDCVIASMPPAAFENLIKQDGEIAMLALEKLVRIVRSCDERILDLATLSAFERVYRALLDLADPDPAVPGQWLIYPLPTQAKISSDASTTRETVARVMSGLVKDGVTRKKGRSLYILDVEALTALAKRGNIIVGKRESR
ncbi:MAG: Crp/Fnr family transcriptional regulator [Alphaproteobacteria bacterium]